MTKPQTGALKAFAAGALLAAASPAYGEVQTYFGGGHVTRTENCSWWQAELVHQFRARYSTEDEEHGAPASLAFFFDVFSISYEVPGGLSPGRTITTGMYGATFAHTYHYLPEEARPVMHVTAPPVNTVISADQELHLLISFDNWVAEQGCTAEVQVWLRRLGA